MSSLVATVTVPLPGRAPLIAALVIAGLPILFVAPARYKIVEGLATLSLVVHLWALTIQHVSGWPS